MCSCSLLASRQGDPRGLPSPWESTDLEMSPENPLQGPARSPWDCFLMLIQELAWVGVGWDPLQELELGAGQGA